MEASLLRIVTGLSNADIYPQISRVMTEQAHYREVFALQEAEEYNRVVVLTLARAMHINGSTTSLNNRQQSLYFLPNCCCYFRS